MYSDSRRIRPAETGDVSVNLPRKFFPTLSPWNYHNLNGNRNFCLTRRRRRNIHLLQQFRASLLPLQKGWYTCMWITEIMKKSLVLKASYPLYLGLWILNEKWRRLTFSSPTVHPNMLDFPWSGCTVEDEKVKDRRRRRKKKRRLEWVYFLQTSKNWSAPISSKTLV